MAMDFVNEVFMNLLAEDGLVVLARGLGLDALVLKFLHLYCDPCSLVLVLGTNPEEEEHYIDELLQMGVSHLPKTVTNETAAKEREMLYMQGGVLFVTSRILVVDLLRKTCPVDKVAGVLVPHAHIMSDSSTEAFILRLYRQDNKVGFVKAFSDVPELLVGQFGKIERIMRNLFVRNLYIWPRFHASVVDALSRHKPDVVELRQRMTSSMSTIQVAILDVMKECLEELWRGNKWFDEDVLSLEDSLTKAFDAVIRLQVDPVWNQLGFKSKQLVFDLKTLRTLLYYLTQYDCVSFYRYLERLRVGEGGVRSFSDQSGWIFMEAANTLFTEAKKRVFGSGKGRKGKEREKDSSVNEATVTAEEDLLLEESPKWSLLKDVLDEIAATVQKPSADSEMQYSKVVVVTNDERTSCQLQEYLTEGGRKLLEGTFQRFLSSKSGGNKKVVGGRRPKNKAVVRTTRKKTKVVNMKPSTASSAQQETAEQGPRSKKARLSDDRAESGSTTGVSVDGTPLPVQGHGLTEGGSGDEEGHPIPPPPDCNTQAASFTLLGKVEVVFHALNSNRHSYGFSHFLREAQPGYVILYDPDVTCVRQLEMHRARTPGVALRVYFLFYDSSVEEQRYLTALRKEKEAFHQLIREKGHMVIPEEQEGRTVEPNNLMRGSSSLVEAALSTRKAGGQSAEVKTIIVDIREFRSALPSLIHKRGMEIVPLTLEVGDYILTPDICVERKSISDLIGSLNSGRLYNQVTAMLRYYKTPVLLIEFSEGQSFSLQSKSAFRGEISIQSLTSKLALLTMHFPKLKLLWTQTPHATAALFEELKVGKPQPSPEGALGAGSASGELVLADCPFNVTPLDFILKCPGISSKNYRQLMSEVSNLQELVQLSTKELERILGNDTSAQLLWSFLHSDYSSQQQKQKSVR